MKRWNKQIITLTVVVALLAAVLVSPLPASADSNTWTPMTSGTLDDLWGVWGSSSTDVFAVGDNGTILQYDGSDWTPMTSGTAEWF
ncbi:hypothetical protein ACFLWV_04270, partial [Chloroflexota bacterium]